MQTGNENTPFSATEQQRISDNLRELKEYMIANLHLTASGQSFVEARLSYLEEASRRMGRKDWIIITVGVLVTIAVNLALPPETVRELFRVATDFLEWLLHEVPLLSSRM